MKAIILAAGQGTRLKKYTENLPKGMLTFAGKTIIERQIEMYKACGVNDIIVVRGFAADKINYSGVTYYTNEEYATTNMVESLLCAKEEFDDDIIVSYSDIIFDEKLVKGMIAAEGDYLVAVDDEWKSYWSARYGKIDFDTESLSIDADNRIIELGKESPELDSIDARYIGILKFSTNGLHRIMDTMNEAYNNDKGQPWQQSGKPVKKAYMTDLLNELIDRGETVKAVHFNHGWLEFDTNEDYEETSKWIETGKINEFVECI